MNEIARGINARRNEFDAIVNDFRAVWAKVYRDELKAEFDAIVNEIRAAKENGLNKDEMKQLNDNRYALEQIQAKVKSLNLSADERELVRTMHDDDGLTFANLTREYIIERLSESTFVKEFEREDGTTIPCIMEQKKNKDTGEKEWKIVERWTVMKVGRYFRLANVA